MCWSPHRLAERLAEQREVVRAIDGDGAQAAELGWAHSVEAWTAEGDLAGALYGLHIGGLFAGESMVHFERDGSKVALLGLVDLLRQTGATLLDVQWATPHLRSLGAVAVDRRDYLARLGEALAQPVG